MITTSDTRPAALITGAAVRLGKAIAIGLAQAGYDIALHFHTSADAAEATANEIKALGVECAIFQHDLSNAHGLDALVGQVVTRFPNLNVLINSASGYESGPIRTTTPETFDAQFALNLRAPFFLTQAFAHHVQVGNIIQIVDNKIGFNQFHYAAYLLAKKALVEFTKMAALELAPMIRVNGIAPGVVLPADTRSEEYIAWRVQGIPLQKKGDVQHINQAIRFVLENDFLTGQVLVIDGGESITNSGQNAESYQAPDS